MGNSHHKKSKDTRNSNCSVYNLSLESNNHAIENIDNSSIDSDFDIKNDLKKKLIYQWKKIFMNQKFNLMIKKKK